MDIIGGKITVMETSANTSTNIDVFVDWCHNGINWSPDQKSFAYLTNGFQIDFCLAQLGQDFEDIHVDNMSQMSSAMADIAGSLHVAIYGLQFNDFDKDDNEEDEGFRW